MLMLMLTMFFAWKRRREGSKEQWVDDVHVHMHVSSIQNALFH